MGWAFAALRRGHNHSMSIVIGWDPQREPRWLAPFRAAAAAIASGESGFTPWTTIDDSQLVTGTRVHLMLQGEDRGKVATGRVCTSPFYSLPGTHAVGALARHVMVEWQALLPAEERITVAELKIRVPSVDWDRTIAAELPLDESSTAKLDRVWVSPHPSAAPGPARYTAARRLRGKDLDHHVPTPALKSG